MSKKFAVSSKGGRTFARSSVLCFVAAVAAVLVGWLQSVPVFAAGEEGEFLNPLTEASKKIDKVPKKLGGLAEAFSGNYLYVISLFVVLALIFIVLRMRKVKFTTRMMVQIGVVLALSIVLDMLRIYRMPQGGSITPGSMVPLFLLALAYGPDVGMMTGFLFGLLDLLLGGSVVHPLQMFLDYPLAFLCMGFIGFFRKNYYLGAVVATLGQLLCSTLSGVIFFSEYAGSMNPWLYSVTYNATFMGVNLLVNLLVLTLLPVPRLVRTLNSQAPAVSKLSLLFGSSKA